MKKPRPYRAKLIQGGIVVAKVEAPTFEQAEREIMHYATDGTLRRGR